jgi:hypothetical protein
VLITLILGDIDILGLKVLNKGKCLVLGSIVRISLSPGIFQDSVLIELYLACRNKLGTWPFGID